MTVMAPGEVLDELERRGLLDAPPRGSLIDWSDTLEYSPQDDRVYDTSDLEAKDISRMLERDGTAQMVENALTLPLRSASGRIVGGKGDKGEADDVTERLMRSPEDGGMSTPMDLIGAQMTSAVAYRRFFAEKSFRRDPRLGGVSYSSVELRPASTCRALYTTDVGRFDGFLQVAQPWLGVGRRSDHGDRGDGYVRIERPRAMMYVHGQHREPLRGLTDMAVPYWCWKAKQKLTWLWFSVYLETVALPRTTVSGPDGPRTMAVAKRVSAVKGGGVIVTDSETAVNSLDVSGQGGSQFKAAIDWLDSTAAISALLGFQTLASSANQGAGSNALGASLQSFYIQSRQAILNEMDRERTRQIIAPLVRWNRGPNAVVPKYQSDPMSKEDIEAALTLYQAALTTPAGPQPGPVFWDELTAKLATAFDLDAGKVADSIKSARAKEAAAVSALPPDAQAVAGLLGGATAAARMVQAATGRPAPGQPPAPPA
jgi:hypothetical protein